MNNFSLLRFIQKHQTGGGLKGGKRTSVWNPLGYVTLTPHCAEWANSLLRENGYNVWGDAWALSGVTPIYNGYQGVKRPKEVNETNLIAYNQLAADNVQRYF